MLATVLYAQVAHCFAHVTTDSGVECITCAAGYFLRQNRCLPLFCEREIAHCSQCDPANGARCMQCNSAAYTPRDGLCVASALVINGEVQQSLTADFDALKITAYDAQLNRLVHVCRPGLFRFEDACLQFCDIYDLARRICQTPASRIAYSSDEKTCWSGFRMSASGQACKIDRCFYYEDLELKLAEAAGAAEQAKQAVQRVVYGCKNPKEECVEGDQFFLCHQHAAIEEQPCRYQIDSLGRCANYQARMWGAFAAFLASVVLCTALALWVLALKKKVR